MSEAKSGVLENLSAVGLIADYSSALCAQSQMLD